MLDCTTNAGAMAEHYQVSAEVTAKRLFPVMRDVGLMLQRSVREDKLQGQALNPRTRGLTRAIYTRTEMDGRATEIVTRVGADLDKAPQGRVMELGGVIRPKHAKRLAIPVGRALTPAGVAKVSARTFMDNPASLGFTGAYIAKFPGSAVIMGVRGKGKRQTIEPVFALKSSVTIKPHSYLGSTLRDKRTEITARIDGGVADIVRQVAGF